LPHDLVRRASYQPYTKHLSALILLHITDGLSAVRLWFGHDR